MTLPSTIPDTLRNAPGPPGADAVVGEDGSLTRAELSGAVDRAAAALRDAGVGGGDRVAVMLPNSCEIVVVMLAVLRVGAAVVPINTALTASEVAHQLTDCRAKAMVLAPEHVSTVAALRGTLPLLEHVWVAGVDRIEEDGMGAWRAALAAADAHPADVGPTADDVALLAYTSGTTDQPRAAVLTHAQLLANQDQLERAGAGLGPDDVVFTALPLFHIYAFNAAMGMALRAGATLVVASRFDPASARGALRRHGVTVLVGAPPMYAALLESASPAGRPDTSTVRLATCGAARLAPELLTRCAEELGLDVREGYGLAEAGPVVTSSVGLPAAVPASVGRPLPGVEVRIVDPSGEVAEGDPGHVTVRGPNVFSGYWGDPALSARVLDADGWLDTGDIGYLDDGLLYLVDRAKDVVIVSGFNVYPVEVERALDSHPEVAEAVVVGVPHPYTGEAVKAVVVRTPGSTVTERELITHAGASLARFKWPASVEFVGQLPTAVAGKVRRRFLRDGS